MSQSSDRVRDSLSVSPEQRHARLQYTVEYAYDHSPFYRDLMDEHGVAPDDVRTFEDLERLPAVTGDDIRQQQPPVTDTHRFRTDTDDLFRPFATSGSMGHPKMVYYSHDEFDVGCAAYHSALQQFGVTEDEMILNYFPNVGLNLSGAMSEATHREYGYRSLPLHHTDFETRQEASLIESHDPSVMVSLTSHAHARGQQFVEAGYDPSTFGIDTIVLAGEPATAERRDAIEALFDATTYDMLGITEVWGIVAVECADSPLLHVDETLTYAEVLDSNGTPVGPETDGRLTLTKLLPEGTDSAMPLLRYQPGDITAWHDGDCSCAYAGHRFIEPPVRAGWQFNLGAVVLDAAYFEEIIYGHPAIEEAVTDYQLYLDADGTGGTDRLEVRIATQDDTYAGVASEDVSVETPTETVADELGEAFLTTRSTVQETVDIVDAAQLDVRFVADIDHSKGKPDRLIDTRNQ